MATACLLRRSGEVTNLGVNDDCGQTKCSILSLRVWGSVEFLAPTDEGAHQTIPALATEARLQAAKSTGEGRPLSSLRSNSRLIE
jgi:hypothetical protein